MELRFVPRSQMNHHLHVVLHPEILDVLPKSFKRIVIQPLNLVVIHMEGLQFVNVHQSQVWKLPQLVSCQSQVTQLLFKANEGMLVHKTANKNI